MKIVVTGSAGFIGKNLCRRLKDLGHEVVGIDKKNGHDLGTFLPTFYGFDIVFHLAANSDISEGYEADFRDGVEATQNVFAGCMTDAPKIVVYASSSAVYGWPTIMPVREDEELCPVSPYGASKVYGESIFRVLAEHRGITCVALRLGNVIGPDVTHGLLFNLRQQLREHPEWCETWGDGTQSKDYIHVSDVVDAMVRCTMIDSMKWFTALNIGSGTQMEGMINIAEIARMMADKFGAPGCEVRHQGGKRGFVGDVTKMLLANYCAKLVLGWTPTMDSRAAVRKAIEEMP